MAEAVVGSIAETIVAILGSPAIEMVGKLWAVKRELKALKGTVSTLRAVLHHAEEQYYQSSQVQDWVEKLKDALYDAQDVLEEFNIEAMRREPRGHKEIMKEVRTFFSSSNQLAFKLKMGYKVRAVRESIDAIAADKGLHLEERFEREREWRKREETHSFICERDIIGRGDDKEKVIKLLLDSNVNEKENVSILPIVGIGGLGKTALAQCVYNDEMVSKHFHLKMWVCVSNDFDVKKIVTNIIACAKKKAPSMVVMEQLQSELRAEIDGKRYFLVLDDLWNEEPQKWLSLKKLLVGGARGSKILITTRRHSVAKITGTAPPHNLTDLSESASVDLLVQMAGQKIDDIQESDMLAIVKEIVGKCYGVPLVIRTVGSVLFLKKTKAEWLHFKDHELPDVSQREEGIKSILKLSYDHLPSHLKQCFAFCSLFPKDYEIKKRTLVDLWLAEGFIRQSNARQHLEDIAHGYFMDLLWSNFFQDFQKDPHTNEETCKMHDLMHDLACLVAGTECRVAWDDTKPILERTRHISQDLTSMGKLPISHLKASALRTFLYTAGYWEVERREPMSEAYLRQLIQSFKRLRTLDLHATNVEKVPKSICKLKHLTYLDLSHNETLRRLPNSITRLQNLQTLNLEYCESLEELPKDIRKLVNLRNLNIDFCHKLGYVPHGLGQLSSLHRLTRFILPKDKALAKDGCRLAELNGLNDIRGSLSIENLGSETDAVAESRAANLIGKHSLESLLLNWGNFDTDDALIGDRDEALLDGLQPHSNLQELTIRGYNGESFPKWMTENLSSSLPNLVEVRISYCGRCKRLPPLGQLSRLKSLSIRRLPELEDIEPGHSSTSTPPFPSLLELTIDSCMKLKAMPPFPSLEKLTLVESNPALINMIFELHKLKSLTISDTELPECLLEECLKSLTSLESLRITGYNGESFPKWMTENLSSSLPNLVEVRISSCGRCKRLPPLGQLSRLKSLSIVGLPELEDIEPGHSSTSTPPFPSLLELTIDGCMKLKAMPQTPRLEKLRLDASNPALINMIFEPNKLKSLGIWETELPECLLEECLKSLTSLESLHIIRCHGLTSLSPQHLSNLVELIIYGCKELDLCKDESGNINILDFHGGLQNLRSVVLGGLPKLASLPQWFLWLRNVESLQIFGCPSLTSLPEGMRRLASLTYLGILDCPELERRCKRDGGEDWDKIAHIPDIQLG